MNNIYVSQFKNYKSTNPIETSLLNWFKDGTFSKEVEKIRNLSDKSERDILKSNLPCITPSGTFTERKASGLIKHSGYICIDIDEKDNPEIIDFRLLRNELRNITNVAYSSLSVSGKGVFCLIPIKFCDKHKEHFESLKICFEKLGIIIDKSCGDVSRLRGYSYDPDAYFNEDAVLFEQIYDYRKIVEQSLTITPHINHNKKSFENITKKRVLKIISEINISSIDITENYEQWFQIGCSLANEFGEDGRDMFHLISKNHPKYHFDSCDRHFNTCLNSNYSYTIGTFFHYAEQYGLK
jgi:hypothetical protein